MVKRSPTSSGIHFAKLQGIGNDFVVIDARSTSTGQDFPAMARAMCDRHRGIGADGILLVESSSEAYVRMRMLNPDGSESEMCGNGVRCFGRYLWDRDSDAPDPLPVETGNGVLELVRLEDGRIRVDMGPARLTRGAIGMTGPEDETFVDQPIGGSFRGTAVSMGNPHLVIFVSNLAAVDLSDIGPALERHPLFPHRTNVHFVSVEGRHQATAKTWERGAGATLACGTGACAIAVASAENGLMDRRAYIHLPGGTLEVEYSDDGTVYLTGPADWSFEGIWPSR